MVEREVSSERKQVLPQLEVIVGPMFSGKTDELMRRLRRAEIAHLKVQLFKPSIDIRYGNDSKAHSHSGRDFDATLVDRNNPHEILEKLEPNVNVVGIEEAQFMSSDIVGVCEELLDKGKTVIVAGLDMDFRGEPFGLMPILLAKAEKKDSFDAICVVCNSDGAHFTQRIKIVDGKRIPANYDDPQILVGTTEDYEARCRRDHEVPGKPGHK